MRASRKAYGTIAALSMAVCLCVPALTACNRGSSDRRPVAVRGVLDLKGWSFERDGSVNLDGEWEFCWDRLLEPADFAKGAGRGGCGYMEVPGLWTERKSGGAGFPGRGRATYRLTLLSDGTAKAATLGIHRIYSAYRLWINGTLVDTIGSVDGAARAGEYYIFVHNIRQPSFTLKEGRNEVVFQVSNREYESGGIDSPLQLDDRERVMRRGLQGHSINMIVVGLLLFASVYNILFFFSRKTDASPLYLGFTSIVWAVNTYNIQSPILSGGLSYPGNPFLINYITVILGMTMIVMTMKSLFPDDFSMGVVRFFQAAAAALITLLFFIDFRAAEIVIKIYFIVCILFIMYGLSVFVQIIKNRRDGALLFFVGFVSIFLAGINNVLYALWIINTGNVIQYAMVVLCFTSTMVISRRFSRALGKVEELSRDLEEKNLSLTELDRLKDQFLASTSHELRTPLHGMIGLSESMIDGAAGGLPPKAIENLSLISSSGHRLAGMVNDLLDMGKLQGEGMSLNLRPVDLRILGDTVVRLSIPLAGGKPLEIVNAIGQGTPRVFADEERIRQVLFNLVGNAVKFTSTGQVELAARVVGGDEEEDDAAGAVEVRVSDTGIGVPEEDREAIFETYRQADGGDTRVYGGTGLGLAIAKQIVELHGGAIAVAPRKEGGTVFSFTLPLADERAPEASDEVVIESLDDGPAEAAAGMPEPDGNFDGSPALLAVDDDPVSLRVIQNYLESKGCTVKAAPDGITALEIIDREGPIDLVLLDIMMPVMSGYEVCRRIRAERSPEELPVIMLTAKNRMADIDAAFAAGANDYVVKPFRITELLARVRTMLKLRNVRRSAARGITIRDRNRAYSIVFGEIVYITSHSKRIIIHTVQQDIEVPVMLKEIIERLPPDLFVRVHKSHIVNADYIHSVSHVLSGRYRVRLRDDDDTELPVGPAFLESLRKKI
ncbi:MAG: response regulator [Spirochaetes bacterium]|nr:response regulator [Spirochaetota bacterium]